MKPNFLIIGSPKCGTTSLFYYLNEHPEIFLPKQKELHYFTSDILAKQTAGKYDVAVKKFHIKSLEAYEQLYQGAELKHKAIGDVSPSYINHPEIIDDIKKTLSPNTKIIILLRDPVKRAYSNYLHMVREGRETLSFDEALKIEDERGNKGYSDFWRYRFLSDYFAKVDAYKKMFGEVLVLNFEAFIKDIPGHLKNVYSFLEVNPEFLPTNSETAFNPGGVYKKNILTRLVFEQSKVKDFLKKVVPLTAVVKNVKIKLFQLFQEPTPALTKDAETFLVTRLKDGMKQLEKKYDFDISLWNNKLH